MVDIISIIKYYHYKLSSFYNQYRTFCPMLLKYIGQLHANKINNLAFYFLKSMLHLLLFSELFYNFFFHININLCILMSICKLKQFVFSLKILF